MSFMEDRPLNATEQGNTITIVDKPVPPVFVEAPETKQIIRREWKFVVMALVLVGAVFFGTIFRAFGAAKHVTYGDIVNFTGVTCVITDRYDQPIYKEGKIGSYTAFGNLIGQGNRIHNSLLYRHAESLCPDGVDPLRGYTALESEPRVMYTTLLPKESQLEIAKMFGKKSGCCYAYNYETGEIYMALSLPAYDPSAADATYFNRCFNSVYVPGSTMKIITTALAVDQGKNIEKMKFECKQTYTLADGKEVKCAGYHGKVDISTAIGKSCNCYFAQFIETLNLDKALASLKKLGFSVNGTETKSELVDGLFKTQSSTHITNTSSFSNLWGLIGQGETQVSPIDMARLAAAIVNGGEAAQPRIVKSIVNPNKDNAIIYESEAETVRFFSQKTANKTAQSWKKGVNANYYRYQGMSSRIDYAKTGTAEHEGRSDDKLLVGVIESSKTAFYIVVESAAGGTTPMAIANKLVQLLPSN